MHKQELPANETTQHEATAARNCLTCQNWMLKRKGDTDDIRVMSRMGLARCELGPRWTFYPPLHQCPKQTPVALAVAAVRVAWEAKA